MSGNDFDPIRERVARILREARPGPGDHLPQEDIDALAGQRLGENDPVPEHLRACPFCWRRVFQVRRSLALERVGRRERETSPRLRVPIVILEKAVTFLAPVPGLQPAYAFTQGAAPPPVARIAFHDASLGSFWRETPLPPSEPAQPSEPSTPPESAQPSEPPQVPERRSAMERPSRRLMRMQQDAGFDAPQSAAPHLAGEVFALQAATPARASRGPSVSILLPVEGLDCLLIVTRRGDRCDLNLEVRVPDTSEPVPGARLTLHHGETTLEATADDMGVARLSDVPLGHYDLTVS